MEEKKKERRRVNVETKVGEGRRRECIEEKPKRVGSWGTKGL